jgi:hypothetical protein
MLLLFPFIYIAAFLYGIFLLAKSKMEGLLIFVVVALPIYINTMSVSFMTGFGKAIPYLQFFKELLVIISAVMIAFNVHKYKKIQLHFMDKLMIFFFLYTLSYLIIPIGSYSIFFKLLAFKNISFFPLLYFIGRFVDFKFLPLHKIYSFILVVMLVAFVVALFEKITYTHLHSITGYADYNLKFFDAEPTGKYCLSWTFETESGSKRFGSIFSNPLEFAAAIILALTISLAMVTYKQDKLFIKFESLQGLALIATFLSILFAASRASFMSYFLVLYIYAWVTNMKKALFYFHIATVITVIVFIYFVEGNLYEYVVNTITFTNTSSLGHIIEWLDGIDAMTNSPLGLGLGESGRVANASGDNIGGENQLIIIGVQAGVIAMFTYLTIYISLMVIAIKNLKKEQGPFYTLALIVLLIKVGLLIPMFTANIDSYIYVSYLSWFLAGLLINFNQSKKEETIALCG